MRSTSRADVTRSAILAHLGAQGSMTRASLARTLGVSPALITQLTKDLVREGLIEEGESERSDTGRPGRKLQLVASRGTAIGVKIASDHIAYVEVRLDGVVVRTLSEPFAATEPQFMSDLTRRLRRFVAGSASAAVLGIGIGLPGAVDEQASGVVESPSLQWQSVALGEALRTDLGLPVVVENNVNALAVAERLYGRGRQHSDFLVVTLGYGIGAAIVVGGLVLRGAHGGAGEFGSTPVVFDDGGTIRRGPLESFISDEALVVRAQRRGIVGCDATLEAVLSLAEQGDVAAARIFSEAGYALGAALAGAVNLIDPEVVIISGEGSRGWPLWEAGFEPEFRTSLFAARRSTPVVVENWQDEGWARGAAALVLATPFDSAGIAGRAGAQIRARLQSTIQR